MAKLNFTIWKTSVEAQKINGIALETYNIQDSLRRVWFFEETFLLVDTNMKVILEMLFLALSNAYVQFDIKKFSWRFYIIAEALSTTSGIELINKREFAKVALNKNSEIFVVYVVILKTMPIHPFRISQIWRTDGPMLVVLQ